MAEITHIDQERDIPDALVPYLMSLLARAQRGEITSVAVVGLEADGNFVATWAGDPERAQTLMLAGATAYLQAVLTTRLRDLG